MVLFKRNFPLKRNTYQPGSLNNRLREKSLPHLIIDQTSLNNRLKDFTMEFFDKSKYKTLNTSNSRLTDTVQMAFFDNYKYKALRWLNNRLIGFIKT